MKKRISILMIITLLIFTLKVDTVKADTLTENWSKTFNLAKENVQALKNIFYETLGVKNEKTKKAINSLIAPLGFIVGYVTISEQNFHDIFNMKSYGGVDIGGENATDDEVISDVADYIYNHVEFKDNKIIYGNDIKLLLKDYADYIQNHEPWHYMYSFDVSETTTQWNNGVVYNRVRDIIRDNQNNYYVLYQSESDSTYNYVYRFWYIPKSDTSQFCYDNGLIPAVLSVYDYYTWQPIYSWYTHSISVNEYYFNGTTLVKTDRQKDKTELRILLQDDANGSQLPTQNGISSVYSLVTTSSIKDQVVVWDSINAMKEGSVGHKGYYINDSYNTNITDSNNTYDSSNSNNVTFGDVTNYINNYYGSNGEYPTQPDINIYINNNIPSGDGGGNGGGSSSGQGASATATATTGNVTVNNNINVGWPSSSGNSVSQNEIDQGTNSIFGFISSIAKYLADLIKNVGSALAELIGALTSIITDITENIPNLFSGIIEIVFSGLPDEIRAVIMLGITLMVTYGIFKMIRG